MKALLLSALLAQALDGGVLVPIVQVERGALLQADGGIVDVRGGTWFSTPEVMAMGQDHADLRRQIEHLQTHAPDVPFKWLALAAATGLTVGIIAGAAGAAAAKGAR